MQFAIRREASCTNRRQLERERDIILEFADSRAEFVIEDMTRSFGLGGRVYYVAVTGKDGASVRLNTLDLHGADRIRSCYFTEHSVRLSTDSPRFDHWIINGIRYNTPEITLDGGMALNGNIRAEVFLTQ
jgi:hypothetical protein